ncbi:MAG: hypothetical protein QOD07_1568 [Frankiaceae bacterium]|jgi:hypothetical protein|nr:hypothetical protein [Frankiaceae bacterium]
MSTTPARYAVAPIAPEVLAELRVRDDAGRVPSRVQDHDGGSPLRCCLRASEPGETLLLASYAPLRRWAAGRGIDPGAYDEVGPVFAHPKACAGPAHTRYPDDLRGTPRVFRAYGVTGRIVGGVAVGPHDDPEPAIEGLLADPDIAVVHARAVVYGCFTFAVERARC